MISATLFSDPACPWAYSESPALRVLEWRYGDQLDWRLVLIGLTETASQYEERGYTPLRGALGQVSFRRYGMPFTPEPQGSGQRHRPRLPRGRRRPAAEPGQRVGRVPRAAAGQLQHAACCSTTTSSCARCCARVDGIDADDGRTRCSTRPRSPRPTCSDREETREAEGSAAELQGKTSTSDGPVRFTAPSLVLQSNGTRLVAGGFQPVEAYDVLIANIDPTLHRELPPETPEPLLEHFPGGLTTQEVAQLLTPNNGVPDRPAAEAAMVELVASGEAVRESIGDDALWKRRRLGELRGAAAATPDRRSPTAFRTRARRRARSPRRARRGTPAPPASRRAPGWRRRSSGCRRRTSAPGRRRARR